MPFPVTPDADRFGNALSCAKARPVFAPGIGTLGEKTLHAVLKYYFDPDESHHEIAVGRKVADIVNEDGIIEIQTRSFENLRPKLSAFLPDHPVTVVYPLPSVKYLCWLDPGTGSLTPKRRSPKSWCAYDAFRELYKIKAFLTHPNLSVCLLFLELTEYRTLDGWSRDRKKGSTRFDRLPEAVTGIRLLRSAADYAAILPEGLPVPFSSADLASGARIRRPAASLALNVLKAVGAVEEVGKKGNALLYRVPDFS